MSLTTPQLAQVLGVLLTLLAVAHIGGQIFARLRQPPVIGEIVGGLLVGPTVLGTLAPDVANALFGSAIVDHAIGTICNLGLLALMFVVGTEIADVRTAANERRIVAWVTASGLLVPFAAGLAGALLLDTASLSGAHGTPATVALVFALAIAVTSVPVISRILRDLGLLQTTLARRVITVAVLEDICLYGVLAVVLALAEAQSGHGYGFWAATGIDATGAAIAYYVVTTIVFFVVVIRWGPAGLRLLTSRAAKALASDRRMAFELIFLLGLSLVAVMLGINPIFGALLAGACVARCDERSAAPERARDAPALTQVAFAFFIPLYFAGIGLSLNLADEFDPVFFLGFLAFACTVKVASVWGGARLAGETRASATNLAVALNARGGPGIVLASVTLSAGIINTRFFTSLVVLSIVTSQVAGTWLAWRFRAQSEATLTGSPMEHELAGARHLVLGQQDAGLGQRLPRDPASAPRRRTRPRTASWKTSP